MLCLAGTSSISDQMPHEVPGAVNKASLCCIYSLDHIFSCVGGALDGTLSGSS